MWTGVVTNVGIALLSRLAEGGTLTITGAKAGTGTVPEAQLMSRTDISGDAHQLSIIEYKIVDEGIKYMVQFTAGASAYVAMQVGIYASLDGGAETLIAIYQAGSNDGISVPSASELTDFAFTFGALVEMANSGTLNVTIDTSVFVTLETLETALDDADVGFFIDSDGYLCQRIASDEE